MCVRWQMTRPDGVQCTIPPPPGQHQAALLCTAFRAGAEVTTTFALPISAVCYSVHAIQSLRSTVQYRMQTNAYVCCIMCVAASAASMYTLP
jgi:hypothetical protein